MNQEKAYDAEIFPLMTKIIEICKREKIAMLCNFQLQGKTEQEDQYCTTALLGDDYNPTERQLKALRILRESDHFAAFTITTRKATP